MTKLPYDTRLLALALLNYADDHGYFYADPELVRGAVLPREDSSNVRRMIDELSSGGPDSWIERIKNPKFGVIGRIRNFSLHQKIDRPQPSKIQPHWDSTNDRRTIDDHSPLEQGTGNREQGTGKGEEKGGLRPASIQVLKYLNEKADRYYREVDGNLKLIEARLKEPGVTVDGIKAMIDRQVGKWKGTDMEDFLRPETLFRASKFESYYGARSAPTIVSPEDLDELITMHPANRNGAHFNLNASEAQKAEFRALRDRRNSLVTGRPNGAEGIRDHPTPKNAP